MIHSNCDRSDWVVDNDGCGWLSTCQNGSRFSLGTRYVSSPLSDYHRHSLKHLLASSTDVKRAFSHGGLTVSKMRHVLSDSSVIAMTVLGSWCKLPGNISSNELVMSFNNKHKQLKEDPKANHDSTLGDRESANPIVIKDN